MRDVLSEYEGVKLVYKNRHIGSDGFYFSLGYFSSVLLIKILFQDFEAREYFIDILQITISGLELKNSTIHNENSSFIFFSLY